MYYRYRAQYTLCEVINNEEYQFYITAHSYEELDYDEDDSEEFIYILENIKKYKKTFSTDKNYI